MPAFSQYVKCLYCIWPGLIAGVVWYLMRAVDHKTYYGGLPVGVDPLSPQGQPEFEVTRQRDAEKRRIIYWGVGIVAVGYLAVLGFNTFTIKAKVPTFTPTITGTATITAVETLQATNTPEFTATPSITTTYQATATDRIVYWKATVIRDQTVIVTKIVPIEITRIVTETFTPSPSSTNTMAGTKTETITVTPSETFTP